MLPRWPDFSAPYRPAHEQELVALMNVKTPGAGRRTGALESVIVGTSDASDLAHLTPKIQSEHLRRRFNLSPAVAAAIAAHAYAVPENWRGAR